MFATKSKSKKRIKKKLQAQTVKGGVDEKQVSDELNALKVEAKQHFIDQKITQAVLLWERGALLKDAQCMFNYALCLQKGEGVIQDIERAAELYSEAGHMKHPAALYNLALLYVGHYKDFTKAVTLLKQAASLGHPDAFFNAGQLLLQPEICVLDDESNPDRTKKKIFIDAIRSFKAAARQGHSQAMYSLGLIHTRGGPGLAADARRAFQYFEQAAEFGSIDAIFRLGQCHESGLGTPLAPPSAIVAYKQAAALGHREAIFRLAVCYENGIGPMLQCKAAAFKHYKHAANLGHPAAMAHCGICLEAGMGVQKDIAAALEWYERAGSATPVPSALGLYRLGRLRYREEMLQATLTSLEEDIRENYISLRPSLVIAEATRVSKSGKKKQLDKSTPNGSKKSKKRGNRKCLGKTNKQQDSDVKLENQASGNIVHELLGSTHSLHKMLLNSMKNIQEDETLMLQRQQRTSDLPTLETKNLLTKAFNLWSDMINSDPENAVATYYLGLCYETGSGTEMNLQKALTMYRKAGERPLQAAALFAEAMLLLRQIEEDQCEGSSSNDISSGAYAKIYDQAAQLLWRAWLSQNHTDALFNLGVMYENGLVDPKHVKPPVEFMKVFGKYPKAQVGHINLDKNGELLPDIQLRITREVIVLACYQTSVLYGHREAMVNLALCYISGRGVEPNDTEAMKLFCEAAEYGIPAALFYKGVCLELGRGLDPIRGVPNLQQAFACYKKAASQGYHRALHNMGVFFANGLVDGSPDHRAAVDCFRWAARLGNVRSLCDLGVCLQVGRGAEKNVHTARSHFLHASGEGNIDANILLAIDNETGKDINTQDAHYKTKVSRAHDETTKTITFGR